MEEEQSPYKKNFHPFFNKKYLIISVSIFIAVILAILLFNTGKDKNNLEDVYIGKVVEISGDINQIGLVKEFQADDYILIVPLDEIPRDPIYQKLKGKYSIKIIADDENQYIKSIKKLNAVSKNKDEPSKKNENVASSEYTDAEISRLSEELKELRIESDSENDMGTETKNDTEALNMDSETTSENLSDSDLENEIIDQIDMKFNDVYERIYKMFFLDWDEFAMGCLVSNTSRDIYSKGRRWFIYLEDLVKRADQLERVGDQVELEHLKSIDDPRPYESEKVRYHDTTECRILMTNLFEKIRYVKETFEWSKDFSTKNGVHFSRIKSIWNLYFKEYREWYDLVVEWKEIEKAYKIFHEIEKPRW